MELNKEVLEHIKKQPFWNEKLLDDKKEQTTKKVQLIKAYIEEYIYVQANREETKEIIFIDAMCNAGIYNDGDFCSAIEILLVFFKNAPLYPQIKFKLVINDYNPLRIECINEIIKYLVSKNKHLNVSSYADNVDVNNFLEKFYKKHFQFGDCVVFFIDPYNIGTVDFKNIINLIKTHYCEIIYNVFTSDFIRNKSNSDKAKTQLHITNKEEISTPEELMRYLSTVVKSNGKNIKFCFHSSFCNQNNVEIYRLFFATPNKKGVDKFKTAFRKVVGTTKHRNQRSYEVDQLSLFEEQEIEELDIDYLATVTQKNMIEKFSKRLVSYSELEEFILGESFLLANDIIKHVIKPLLEQEKIVKQNKKGYRNYKDDEYYIN